MDANFGAAASPMAPAFWLLPARARPVLCAPSPAPRGREAQRGRPAAQPDAPVFQAAARQVGGYGAPPSVKAWRGVGLRSRPAAWSGVFTPRLQKCRPGAARQAEGLGDFIETTYHGLPPQGTRACPNWRSTPGRAHSSSCVLRGNRPATTFARCGGTSRPAVGSAAWS